MDYQPITNFFERIKNIVSKTHMAKQIAHDVLVRHIGYDIPEDKMTFKNGVLTVSVSPLVKNEILMHQEGITKDAQALGVTIVSIR